MTAKTAQTSVATRTRPPKTKVTPLTTTHLLIGDKRKRLIDALRAGNYQETSCNYAGIGRSTYYDWLAQGRAERDRLDGGGEPAEVGSQAQLYLTFLQDVEQARADAEVRAVSLIRIASQTHWQAAAWWLERTSPQRFGRAQRIDIAGKDGGPLEATLNVTVEDLARALDEMLDVSSPSEVKA